MRRLAPLLAAVLGLAACDISETDFLIDQPRAMAAADTGTRTAPAPLTFPARIGFARTVYGQLGYPTGDEREMWDAMTGTWADLGPVIPIQPAFLAATRGDLPARLTGAAERQALDYLLWVDLDPATGTGTAIVFDVATGQPLATTIASGDSGGRTGFLGGRITNPARLARVTENLARDLAPNIDEMIRGLALRADWRPGA